MIHYHGTPISGGEAQGASFLKGRHALVSFANPQSMAVVAEVCQSFVLDNGAYTAWSKGNPLDVSGYYQFVAEWSRHPGFDWALIPDVIDGTQRENERLVEQWPFRRKGVPVWHMHEELQYLRWLAREFRTVAIGSSGNWPTPGAAKWWVRIAEAMRAVTDDAGRPMCRLHGLRMLDPEIFTRLPFSSADSANAAINAGSLSRFGSYLAPSSSIRAAVIADRIEAQQSAPVWIGQQQGELECG